MTDNKQYIGKSVNAIVIRDGKVLLAWRKSDGEYKLSLPGGPAVEGETPEEYNVTFTDSVGNLVTLNKKPEKVAVLFSSFADIWVSAGGRVDITVGESV